MGSAALLSMWISNTATTLLLLPIGVSVLELADRARGDDGGDAGDLAPALVAGIAFGAGIGGLATLIGTPPNALTAAFLLETYGIRVGFARWMAIGLPLALVALPFTYAILVRVAFRVGGVEIPGGRALIEREIESLGRVSRGERIVAAVFLLAALGWTLRPLLERWALRAEGAVDLPPGEYRIQVISDDAVRVWVDGRLAIDAWEPHESRVDEARVFGGRHDLAVEYYQVDGWVELSIDIQPVGAR
jgi:di/tricarboxylate transporter